MFGALIETLIVKAVETLADIPAAKNVRDDPVYKTNVEKLVARNRKFEEAKE
ncbi:MAG TPA: hypothetical protein VKY22_05555 [Bradyrhizobium sp.]|nr:hypothetical protein [Bradyrhizobium sp.]